MPSVSPNPHDHFLRSVHGVVRDFDESGRQQLIVITDPTESTGDPANNYATVIIGSIASVLGSTWAGVYGIALWQNAQWVLTSKDTGWQTLTLSGSWTGNASWRVVGDILFLRGNFTGGSSGSAVFTLPSQARPLSIQGNVAVCAYHAGVPNAALLQFNTSTGVVSAFYATASSTVAIDGCAIPLN